MNQQFHLLRVTASTLAEEFESHSDADEPLLEIHFSDTEAKHQFIDDTHVLVLPSGGTYADEIKTIEQIVQNFEMNVIDLQETPTRGEPIATVQLDADLDTHIDIAERIAREVYGTDPDNLATVDQF
jgi:hypothetical protein